MAKESDAQSVPTLIDVIIPGETNSGSHGKETPAATPSPPPNQPRHTLNRSSLPRSHVEANIETLISQILNAHMEQMRKELTRKIITDFRTYLNHNARHPPHEFKS